MQRASPTSPLRSHHDDAAVVVRRHGAQVLGGATSSLDMPHVEPPPLGGCVERPRGADRAWLGSTRRKRHHAPSVDTGRPAASKADSSIEPTIRMGPRWSAITAFTVESRPHLSDAATSFLRPDAGRREVSTPSKRAPERPTLDVMHRVALLDDHPAVLAGLRRLIDAEPDLEVVAAGSTAQDVA
jgi:hypothetical protein